MLLKQSFTTLLFCIPAFVQAIGGECGGRPCARAASLENLPSLPPAPASCSFLPQNLNSSLKQDTKLPDPFTFLNGQKARTQEEFACRQAQVNALFQRIELGTLPPRPQIITHSVTDNNVTINVTHEGKSITFNVVITYPTTGTGPFPAVIGVGGISIPIPSNAAVIAFNNDDMAEQNDQSSRGVGKFFDLYGANATASSMMAWVWGISRIIDVLEESPGNLNLDLSKLAVTGCSRNGKGALVTGAFEPRIALTIPQESGSGGAGCWRISDVMLADGIVTQTASEIVQENVWFAESFDAFVNDTALLPFDHHMLAGLVAPRALFVIDNTGIDWLGPESVFGCMKTANTVWQALGIPDHMGVSQVGNHSHCDFPASEQPQLSAFFDKFFAGDRQANTSIIETDGADDLGFVDSDWIDWTIPKLI